MMRLATITFLISCTMLMSCKDNVETTVTGWWTIDTLIYNNTEMLTCLVGNSIEFYDNGSCKLPVTEERCPSVLIEYEQNGRWKIERSTAIPLSLKMESKNQLFKGIHQITFKDDKENGLLKMVVTSNNLYLVCRKGMFDYDHKQNLVHELIEASKGK